MQRGTAPEVSFMNKHSSIFPALMIAALGAGACSDKDNSGRATDGGLDGALLRDGAAGATTASGGAGGLGGGMGGLAGGTGGPGGGGAGGLPDAAGVGDAGVLIPLTDAEILHVAVTANTGEVAEGQLAVTRATNVNVKAFATQMVADHSAAKTAGTATAAA